MQKDSQLHKLLRKRISKLQYDTTSQLLEWLLSTRQVITSVGEVVERKAASFTAGGAVNWYSLYENSMGVPQKKLRTVCFILVVGRTMGSFHAVYTLMFKGCEYAILHDKTT